MPIHIIFIILRKIYIYYIPRLVVAPFSDSGTRAATSKILLPFEQDEESFIDRFNAESTHSTVESI